MSTSSPTQEADRYGITALNAGLKVLKAIGQSPSLTVPQLAQNTGLTKSKVYRIIRTLEQQGFIWLEDSHTIRLGAAALILGRQAETQFTVTEAAAPILDQLEQQTKENVYLLIREGYQSVVVGLRHSPHPVRAFARVGYVGWLHAGGASKVLLAYAPTDVIEHVLSQPLPALTPATITDPLALRALLNDIRRDAYHEAVSDLQDQVVAQAVPVFNPRGQAVAALSVAGPLMRINATHRAEYRALLQEASQAISRRLGVSS